MSTVLDIDDYDLGEARALAASFGQDHFGYVVTPNVDHIIRYCRDPAFRALYARASYVLLDSRFLERALRGLKGRRLKVCTGSDLTLDLLSRVIKPQDATVLVGASVEQAEQLRDRFRLEALRHVKPSMNFIRDEAAVEACLRDIEQSSPFRFCFLAIGSPQQEIIAHELQRRGIARGLALCVGGSINFVTGYEKRAPRWMQGLGCEWLFRLLQSPRRLAYRYLVRGPRIFLLLPRIKLRLRRPTPVPAEPPEGSGTVARSVALGR